MTFIRSVIYGTDLFYFGSLYAVCGMLIALSTWIFSRNKKDFFFNRTVTVLYLLIIVFVSSFLSCFSASALDTFIRPLLNDSLRFFPTDIFSIPFQKLKFGVVRPCTTAQRQVLLAKKNLLLCCSPDILAQNEHPCSFWD